MRVLVTGASGYIGAVMVPYVVAAGHDVTTLDLGLYASGSFSGGVPLPDYRDIRTASLQDVEDVDAIIHLAALSNDPWVTWIQISLMTSTTGRQSSSRDWRRGRA